MSNVHAFVRGQIQNRELATRLKDFSNVRWGAITPTDIDGFLDFGDRLHVYIEGKTGSTPLRGGQRLALQRACASGHRPPQRTVLVLVVETDGSDNYDYAQAVIREVCWGGCWLTPFCPDGEPRRLYPYITGVLERLGIKWSR